MSSEGRSFLPLYWHAGGEETLLLEQAREFSIIERNSLIAEGYAEGTAEALREVARNLGQPRYRGHCRIL
jgi:hypothetical protein